MSTATSKKLTADQQAERLAYRQAKRERAAQKVRNLQAWFRSRQEAGAQRAKVQDKARAKKLKGQRGVDRVPAWRTTKKGNPLQRAPRKSRMTPAPEPVVAALGTYTYSTGPGQAPVTMTANHADRRARGQRGHQRPPRPRELAAHAVAQMTKPERKLLDTEMAKAAKAGEPMPRRVIAERAWSIMADARHPVAPR